LSIIFYYYHVFPQASYSHAACQPKASQINHSMPRNIYIYI